MPTYVKVAQSYADEQSEFEIDGVITQWGALLRPGRIGLVIQPTTVDGQVAEPEVTVDVGFDKVLSTNVGPDVKACL